MYCYTYMNQFTCIFNELLLWTHISSEHPIFLKTVATLSEVNLQKDIQDKLDDIHQTFLALYNNVVYLKNDVEGNPNQYFQHIIGIKKLIDEFLRHDDHALSIYPELMTSGVENKAWQELINHIISEQTFMLQLFKDLRQEIR